MMLGRRFSLPLSFPGAKSCWGVRPLPPSSPPPTHHKTQSPTQPKKWEGKPADLIRFLRATPLPPFLSSPPPFPPRYLAFHGNHKEHRCLVFVRIPRFHSPHFYPRPSLGRIFIQSHASLRTPRFQRSVLDCRPHTWNIKMHKRYKHAKTSIGTTTLNEL